MQRKHMLDMLLLIFFLPGSIFFFLILLHLNAAPAHAFSFAPAVQPIATPIPSPPSPSGPSPDASLQFYGSLSTALIAAGATIIAAVIAGIVVVYQVRRNHRLELEKQQLQFQLDAARQQRQNIAELDKMRYAEKLTVEREEKERERQQRIAAAEAAKATMKAAQTPAQREQAYREAIRHDPDITHLQILDMSQPLEVTKVYVRVRLHEETRLSYDIEAALRSAEQRGDPNAMLKASWASLETRSSAAMTPQDALQKYSHCIVLGDPGAGKSTLLKYLTLKAVNQQLANLPDLPIHIALAEFAYSDAQDLIEFAAARWDERYGFPQAEARVYIEQHLAAGRAMLLLDALDETVIGNNDERAAESYRRVLTAINQMAARYPKAPIVVTARKAGYYRRPRLHSFTELEVLDFRLDEMKQFVINWFDQHTVARRHATANELNTKLEQTPRMQVLAANPLLLCLIVMVYEVQQNLPEKRAELYKQCVDTLLYKWDTSRDIRRLREFKPEHKRQLLMEIAWHFHQQGRRYFPEEELLTVIANFLPTVGCPAQQCKLILSEIEEENGLLKEQAQGWHGFLHLTLQEYFVALYATENNKLDTLLSYCGDPWWEEVFSLYAGSVFDASLLLQKLMRQEKGQLLWKDVFHTNLLWAGCCLVARPRIGQTVLREKVIACLFELLRTTPYSLTEQQVISTLVDIGGSEVKGKLMAILKDKQEAPFVRTLVAQALGKQEERAVVAELLAILKDKQEHAYVRQCVAGALGKLGERAVVGGLLSILKDKQEDAYVRRRVAGVLGELGERAVVPDLLTILNDKQENTGVRWAAIAALVQLDEREAAKPFLISLIPSIQEMHEWDVVEDRQNTLKELTQSILTIRLLTRLLKSRDHLLLNRIHLILWTICQREKVRISMLDLKLIKFVKVSKRKYRYV